MSKYKKFWVGGALNTAMGLGTAIYGGVKEQQAKRKMAQAEELAAGPIRSQAARQRTARQEGDAQASTDAALRAEATAAAQIAETGGSRSLMAASPSLQRSTQQAVLAGLDRFGSLGAQVSALQDTQDLSSINQRLGSDLSRLQGAADAGRAALYGGIGQAIGGVAQIAGGLSPKAAKTTVPDAKATVPDAKATVPDAKATGYTDSNTPMSQAKSTQALNASLQLGNALVPPQIPLGGDLPGQLSRALKALSPGIPGIKFNEGGKVGINTEENDVEETPGEFSHDSNPIDIIQEGEKIGEMTGGEYIFNPEQAEELRALSQEGDSDLHIFIRNLLSKEEFQE
jgi:hypothetical protein